jgi:hypothetical protein
MWGITGQREHSMISQSLILTFMDTGAPVSFARVAALIIGLLLLFVLLRYFMHIIIRMFHFALSFFWHGCLIVIVIGIALIILHNLGVF